MRDGWKDDTSGVYIYGIRASLEKVFCYAIFTWADIKILYSLVQSQGKDSYTEYAVLS